MKLTRSPSLITGVRVGEIKLNLLNAPSMHVDYILLRDPQKPMVEGINAGRYTKSAEWEPKVQEALEKFIEALEEAVLPELFEVDRDNRVQEAQQQRKDDGAPDRLSFPGVPTLGDGGRNSSHL